MADKKDFFTLVVEDMKKMLDEVAREFKTIAPQKEVKTLEKKVK